MSRIDDLIAEHCPRGVEFKALGEIADLVRGNGMPKSDFKESGVGCIHYGQIYTYYGVWATETISFVATTTATRLAKVDKGDLIITNTSENLEDVCKAVAWLGKEQIVTGGHATVIKHKQDPKYLAYFFRTPDFFAQKKKLATGTKVIDVSAKSLAKIRIPVPPLDVQREIVKVLDTFTKLEAELEAELEARRRQYQYYRDALLSFDERTDAQASKQASKQLYRWMTLGEIATYSKSRTPSSGLDADSYVGVDNLLPDMRGRTSSSYVPISGTSTGYEPNDILIGNIRPYLKKIWLADAAGGTNQDVLVVQIKERMRKDLKSRFLYHQLASEKFFAYDMQHAKGAKMPRGDKESILKYEIAIPPIEEQERIVSILDKFDTLVNDLSSGLPAELEARRQQYEHYRDRLLTFREAA